MNSLGHRITSSIIAAFTALASNVYANTPPTVGDIGPFSVIGEHVCEYRLTYQWKPFVFDADGDPLTCRILTQGAGIATVADDCSGGTYKPPCYIDIYVGTASFTYVANDGTVDSNPGMVTVTVIPNLCSLPPITLPTISFSATPGTSLSWFTRYKSSIYDYCQINSLPQGGAIMFNTAACTGTYVPNPGFLGQDKIAYTYYWIYEGASCSQPQSGEILVNVAESNPVPTAGNVAASVPSGKSLSWKPVVSDPSGDALRCRIVTAPKNGTANIYLYGTKCEVASYKPADGFVGTDSFTYVANDGQNDSNVATVTVTVTDPIPPPSAADIYFSVIAGQGAIWTPNITAPYGTLRYCYINTTPMNGAATVALDCTTGTYQPNPGFVGSDSFTYKVSNGEVFSNPATATAMVSEGSADLVCTQNNPVSRYTQSGKLGTLSIIFTGNITSRTNKEVKVCPGTTLSYTASSTKDSVKCKIKNNLSSGTGTLRIKDHLKCTDKPGGKDKLQFKVKSGVK